MKDLLEILFRIPRGGQVFLRPQYDALWPAMKIFARLYRMTVLSKTRLIAVTGSVGKTTAKKTLSAAFASKIPNESWSNNFSCLAENVLRTRPGQPYAVFEVGVACAGAMSQYGKMLRPDVVVVTWIQGDHRRSFKTFEATRDEKVKLVRALPIKGVAVLNGDDPNVRWMASQTKARAVFYGLGDDNDVRASNIVSDWPHGTRFRAHIGAASYEAVIPIYGDHMVHIALASIAAAWVCGLDVEEAIHRIGCVAAVPSRMELIDLPGGAKVLDDSAKGSLETFMAAIAAVKNFPAKRRILVLGKIHEIEGSSRRAYENLGREIATCANRVIFIGDDNYSSLFKGAREGGMDRDTLTYGGSDIAKTMDILRQEVSPGDVILIKGTGSQQLRRITLQLLGRDVKCRARYCIAKTDVCDNCPLLDRDDDIFSNRYVQKLVRL